MLVHNGVIENFEELKIAYLANDHFIGETDTEIIAHLVKLSRRILQRKRRFKSFAGHQRFLRFRFD